MITIPRREVPTEDGPEMTRDELERDWLKAKASFDQALVQKTETDGIYLSAATRLNTLDRLLKKVERREAGERRALARLQARPQIWVRSGSPSLAAKH